jgi:hypothetical protein
MRFTALIGCAVVLVACTKKDAAPVADTMSADTTAAAPAPPPAPMSLASMAGTWNVSVKPEGKDTVITTYVLNTNDSTHWTMTFPKGPKVDLKITGVSGDTVMTSTGWFESQTRKGLKVLTDSRTWMQDGKVMGKVVAHYKNAGADSVRMLTSEGVKQ